MTEQETKFPFEIITRFAAACDGNYSTQAKVCRLSRDLFDYTRPRLYRSFNNLLVPPTQHEKFLATVITNPHLAKLVEEYFLAAPIDGWPRSVTTALLRMPNLKHLTMINQQPRDLSDFQDLWCHFFQANSKDIPFQLQSLQLYWIGPANSYPFESMALAMFLGHQKKLKALHLYYHFALIQETDLPELQVVTIDSKNWNSILPGRPILSMSLEANVDDAKKNIMPTKPGVAETLKGLKQLRIDAGVLAACIPSRYLTSLEVLILLKFTKLDNLRESLIGLPKLRVLCLSDSESKPAQRLENATWVFNAIPTVMDIVYRSPRDQTGKVKYHCEWHRRSNRVPRILPGATSYEKLILFS